MAIQRLFHEREAKQHSGSGQGNITRMLWDNLNNNNTSSTVYQGEINLVTQNDRNDDESC